MVRLRSFLGHPVVTGTLYNRLSCKGLRSILSLQTFTFSHDRFETLHCRYALCRTRSAKADAYTVTEAVKASRECVDVQGAKTCPDLFPTGGLN